MVRLSICFFSSRWWEVGTLFSLFLYIPDRVNFIQSASWANHLRFKWANCSRPQSLCWAFLFPSLPVPCLRFSVLSIDLQKRDGMSDSDGQWLKVRFSCPRGKHHHHYGNCSSSTQRVLPKKMGSSSEKGRRFTLYWWSRTGKDTFKGYGFILFSWARPTSDQLHL